MKQKEFQIDIEPGMVCVNVWAKDEESARSRAIELVENALSDIRGVVCVGMASHLKTIEVDG